MWNATHFSTSLQSIMVCPIFVSMLLYKSECHSFLKAFVRLYSVQCVMPHISALVCKVYWNALYLQMCYCISQNVTHLIIPLQDSTVFSVECHIFKQFFRGCWCALNLQICYFVCHNITHLLIYLQYSRVLLWNATNLSTCLQSIWYALYLQMCYCVSQNVTHLINSLRILQCLMWNAIHLHSCLLRIFAFPIIVDMLLCKADCHSFVPAI